jgi:hypothetical protein
MLLILSFQRVLVIALLRIMSSVLVSTYGRSILADLDKMRLISGTTYRLCQSVQERWSFLQALVLCRSIPGTSFQLEIVTGENPSVHKYMVVCARLYALLS